MLTDNQIQYLYKFCLKHYVRYHDVQVEIVDHLAASVENEMSEIPGLGFEDAVNKVYKGFGVSGFSKLVAAKELAAGKVSRKEYFRSFWSFFTLPRITFTLLLFLTLFLPFYIYGRKNETVVMGLVWAYAFLFLFASSAHFRRFKKSHPAPVKTLLTVDGIWSLDNSILVIVATQLLFLIEGISGSPVLNSTPRILVFVSLYVFMIISYMASSRAYHKIYETARKNYPLAFES